MAYLPFPGYWCRIKFQTIHFNINIVFVYKQLNIQTVQLNIEKNLFQTIQISLSKQFSPT